MISLPSHYPAAILIAALAAALLFHLSRILGRQRLVHAAYAAAAVGLIYLLSAAAFGWEFDLQGVLLWVYLALFVLAGAMAARRRATLGVIGLPWLSALIQLGVVAYMFAPESYRKPPETAALFLYFVFEAAVWLRGREEEAATSADERRRRRSRAAAALSATAESRPRRSFTRGGGDCDRLPTCCGAARVQCRAGLSHGAAAGAADRAERRERRNGGVRGAGDRIRNRRRDPADGERRKRAGGSRAASRGQRARGARNARDERTRSLYGSRGRYVQVHRQAPLRRDEQMASDR